MAAGAQLQQTVAALLQRARQAGRPIVIPGAGGIVALPNGQTRMGTPLELQEAGIPSFANQTAPFGPVPTAGPGVPAGTPGPLVDPNAPPAWMHALAGPNMQVTNQPTGATLTSAATGQPPQNQPTPVLNQVNPNVQTYAGQLGWGAPSPPHPAAIAAAAYRVQHGIGTQQSLTTDQLNLASLQAAQAGRTYMQPNLQIAPGAANTILAPNLLMTPAAGANYNALMAGQASPNVHFLAANQPDQGGSSS